MKKKLILMMVAVVAVAVGVVGMSAFEAHVINVTATIENALSVDTSSIDFGTVFPEELLHEPLEIALSASFVAEERVDDVDYVIRQKPKCWNNDSDNPIFGRVIHTGGQFICEDTDFVILPLLCPFLSKHPDNQPDNDGSLDAFHGPLTNWTMANTLENEVSGRLAKSEDDYSDIWDIDLFVPCFTNHCAQDDVIPPEYQLNPELEHALFGCDLWVEVIGVSRYQALRLENKDSGWNVIDDVIYADLVYNDSGSTFNYSLTGQNLAINTEYSLIYYADKPDRYDNWGGDNPGALIGTGTTDGSGNLTMSGNPDLGMDLPMSPDANIDIANNDYCGDPDYYSHCTGAKIWLVLSSDYSEPGLTAWHPSSYLFETDLITYNDTDTP